MFGCYNRSMQRIPHAAELAERRDAPRVDVDGRYSLRVDPCDGREPITCALLDYSVTGVRLQLPEDLALPAEVQIVIGPLSHRAHIVWRNGTTIGVDFIDEHHSIF
ncbi:MAG: hypothetical protein QOF91_3429 [Alphaproteobacteria bacterium]|jgi:hypothetical protein|nr:hypothetical protein [Alphaproteobacteria bacterium]